MTDGDDYASGPFCCHYDELGCCDEECPGCGHRCARHANGHDECEWPGCECESIAEADVAEPPEEWTDTPVPDGRHVVVPAGNTLRAANTTVTMRAVNVQITALMRDGRVVVLGDGDSLQGSGDVAEIVAYNPSLRTGYVCFEARLPEVK